MAANTADAGRTDDVLAERARYAALHVENATMVVYDQRNHRAWVQSDHAVALEGMV